MSEVKEQEARAWEAFENACQAAIEAAGRLREMGAHPDERPHVAAVVAECNSYVVRMRHQLSFVEHQADKQEQKAATLRGGK